MTKYSYFENEIRRKNWDKVAQMDLGANIIQMSQIVNAYYNAQDNSISIPAGI
jgi:predicted metalloendopeptidase